jgi:uncharacterized damage-inducible protein DinB
MREALPLDEVLRLLANTSGRIAELTADVPAELPATRPATTEWSVNEILAHLRSCADVWGDCIALLLSQDHPTLRAINPRQWIKRTDYPVQAYQASLRAFTDQRDKLLPVVQRLTPEQWARTATIRGAGSPLEKDEFSIAHRLALHERSHFAHIARTVQAVQAMQASRA